MTGVITKLTTRGFGFIVGADGRDRFFHASSLANCEFDVLREGDPVTFNEFEVPGKGKRAVDVVYTGERA